MYRHKAKMYFSSCSVFPSPLEHGQKIPSIARHWKQGPRLSFGDWRLENFDHAYSRPHNPFRFS